MMDLPYPNEAELVARGFVRQSTRQQGCWLVYYTNPETWETTQTIIVYDDDLD